METRRAAFYIPVSGMGGSFLNKTKKAYGPDSGSHALVLSLSGSEVLSSLYETGS